VRKISIFLAGIIILTTLSACGSQEPTLVQPGALAQTVQAGGGGALAQTMQAGGGGRARGTLAPGQGQGGTFVPGQGGAARPAGAGGTAGTAPSGTEQPTPTPLPTATASGTPTPLPTATATPLPSLTFTPTTFADSRITITNNSDDVLEFLLYGPLDKANPGTYYRKILPRQTGFLQAPHGRYTVTILKNGKGSTGTYEIRYGGWNCKISPDGCTDAFFPVK
jgi:hypothetical protein